MYKRPVAPVKDEESNTGTKDGEDSMLTGEDSTMINTCKRATDDEDEKEDESCNEYEENQSVKEQEGEAEVNIVYTLLYILLYPLQVKGHLYYEMGVSFLYL